MSTSDLHEHETDWLADAHAKLDQLAALEAQRATGAMFAGQRLEYEELCDWWMTFVWWHASIVPRGT